MKEVMISLFCVFISTLNAQVTKTVNISTAGTLSSQLTVTEKSIVTNLTVTGSINALDFQTVRDEMPYIEVLDISAVQIAAYNAVWYIIPANEIPEMAFSFFDATKKYSHLKTVSLPLTTTSIGRNAFNSCTGLTTINIPASVTNISDGAFWGCTSLSSITVNVQTPLTFGLYVLPFDGVNKTTCTLYVPAGTRTAYKTAEQWKEFVNIVEFTTGLNEIGMLKLKLILNRATNTLKVSSNEMIKYIDIYSISGKLIQRTHINSELFDLNTNQLTKGTYLITGFTNKGIVTTKFVK